MKKKFSIVITVFNRHWCVTEAILSAYHFLEIIGGGEIIIIDDSSTDSSSEAILNCILGIDSSAIELKFFTHLINLGVCAAKNSGAKAATGDWLIFLDSDDELFPGSAISVDNSISSNKNHPIHFFKSSNKIMRYPASEPGVIFREFNQLITRGTDGECLPIIKRKVFLKYEYDEDISGFEGLSYLKIVKLFGPALLYPIVVRKYNTMHDDRLSSLNGSRKRSFDIAIGYWRIIRDHFTEMNIRSKGYILIRVIYHCIHAFKYNLKEKFIF